MDTFCDNFLKTFHKATLFNKQRPLWSSFKTQSWHVRGLARAALAHPDIQWRLSSSVHQVQTQFTWWLLLFVHLCFYIVHQVQTQFTWWLLLFVHLCLYKESIMTTLYPSALCSHAFLPMIYCNSAHEQQN